MADDIRHSRAVSPWFIPNKGGVARDLHGLTDIGGDPSVTSDDVFVIGKSTKCASDKATPEVTVPLTQLERGEIGTYLTLSNLVSEPSGGFSLTDFSNALVDVVYYLKEEFNGDIDKSVWFPKTAIASLNLDIGDPEARITRSFDLTGDNRLFLEGEDNKYLIHKKNTAPSGTSGSYIISLASPVPSVHPSESGVYMLRVDRTRDDETVTLTDGTDFSYNSGTTNLTIASAQSNDVYNIYYSSDSFGGAGDPTTVDSADPCFLKASFVTVLISDTITEVELDRLTSLSISATLNRIDESVIGNDERILREISDTPVTLSLSGRIKDTKTERAFMNTLNDTNSISDVKKFQDNVIVTIKIYNNADKDTFLIGYQLSDLSFTDGSISFTANEFGTVDVGASSTDLKITAVEGNL